MRVTMLVSATCDDESSSPPPITHRLLDEINTEKTTVGDVTSHRHALIIQKAWKKYRNGTTVNNNDTTITNNNVTDAEQVNTPPGSVDMSLSSYTVASVHSSVEACEDLNSDSSCCERGYILNADDDRNNNYFPNIESSSDSADSSNYGSVEDDTMSRRNVRETGGDFVGKDIIWNHSTDTNLKLEPEVRKTTIEQTEQLNTFTRKNYWDFCNQQKRDDSSKGGGNPFGSDFSEWKIDVGDEVEEDRSEGRRPGIGTRQDDDKDLIIWDQSAECKDCSTDSIDLITGDLENILNDRNRNRTEESKKIPDESPAKCKVPDVSTKTVPQVKLRKTNALPVNHPTRSTWRNSMGSYDSTKRSFSNNKSSTEGDFDVYTIETAMPSIDWTSMERHLARAAKEQELYSKRRNDREEIRRKLAMGTESDDYYGGEKMTKKPSLSTRLQSGMNLQICFMNETASDNDSQNSDHELDSNVPLERKVKPASNKLLNDIPKNTEKSKMSRSKSSTSISQRPSFFKESLTSVFHSADKYKSQAKKQQTDSNDVDFVTKQAQLQAEARIALTQAKEMAHMQMKLEKQRKKQSPIIEMVGLDIPNFHRRLTRPILSGMNVAQLQVIVNDFHSQIETLNEDLVKFLLDRDDLHMEQDSMLVDIEDLTRYLGDDKQSEDVKKKVREVKGEPLNKKQTKKYYLSRKFKK